MERVTLFCTAKVVKWSFLPNWGKPQYPGVMGLMVRWLIAYVCVFIFILGASSLNLFNWVKNFSGNLVRWV